MFNFNISLSPRSRLELLCIATFTVVAWATRPVLTEYLQILASESKRASDSYISELVHLKVKPVHDELDAARELLKSIQDQSSLLNEQFSKELLDVTTRSSTEVERLKADLITTENNQRDLFSALKTEIDTYQVNVKSLEQSLTDTECKLEQLRSEHRGLLVKYLAARANEKYFAAMSVQRFARLVLSRRFLSGKSQIVTPDGSPTPAKYPPTPISEGSADDDYLVKDGFTIVSHKKRKKEYVKTLTGDVKTQKIGRPLTLNEAAKSIDENPRGSRLHVGKMIDHARETLRFRSTDPTISFSPCEGFDEDHMYQQMVWAIQNRIVRLYAQEIVAATGKKLECDRRGRPKLPSFIFSRIRALVARYRYSQIMPEALVEYIEITWPKERFDQEYKRVNKGPKLEFADLDLSAVTDSQPTSNSKPNSEIEYGIGGLHDSTAVLKPVSQVVAPVIDPWVAKRIDWSEDYPEDDTPTPRVTSPVSRVVVSSPGYTSRLVHPAIGYTDITSRQDVADLLKQHGFTIHFKTPPLLIGLIDFQLKTGVYHIPKRADLADLSIDCVTFDHMCFNCSNPARWLCLLQASKPCNCGSRNPYQHTEDCLSQPSIEVQYCHGCVDIRNTVIYEDLTPGPNRVTVLTKSTYTHRNCMKETVGDTWYFFDFLLPLLARWQRTKEFIGLNMAPTIKTRPHKFISCEPYEAETHCMFKQSPSANWLKAFNERKNKYQNPERQTDGWPDDI